MQASKQGGRGMRLAVGNRGAGVVARWVGRGLLVSGLALSTLPAVDGNGALSLVSPAMAQTPRNAREALVDPFPDMITEDVAAKAASAVAMFQDLIARRAPRLDNARLLEATLERLAVDRTGIDVPAPPDMTAAPDTLEAAQAMVDRWTRRSEAVDAIVSLGKERLARLDEMRNLSLLLADEADLLARAAADVRPLMESLLVRQRAGELEAEDLPKLDMARLAAEPMARESADWRHVAQRAALDKARTERDVADAQAEVAEDAADVARAQRWLQEATTRANLVSAMGDQPVGELVADFMGQVADFDGMYSDLSRALGKVEAQFRAIERAETALSELVPPEAPPVDQGEGGSGFLAQREEARRAVALAEAVLAYRDEMWNGTRALRSLIREALDGMEDVKGRVGPAVSQALTLDVLSQLLQERSESAGVTVPAEAQGDRYAARLTRLRESGATLAEQETALAARLEELDDAVTAGFAARSEARRALNTHKQVLAREEEWTVFIQDLQDLDAPALIQAFEEANAAYRESAAQLPAIEQAVDSRAEALAAALEGIKAQVDPVQLTVREQPEGFSTWLAAQNLRIEAPPVDTAAAAAAAEGAAAATAEAESTGEEHHTSSAEGEAAATAATPQGEAATHAAADAGRDEPSRAVVWLRSLRELRDGTVVRRRTFYQDAQSLRIEVGGELDQIQAALTVQKDNSQAVLDSARRAWAAAALLRRRVREGGIEDAALPEGVADWTSREALERASSVNGRVMAVLAQLDGPRAELDSLKILDGLINPLEDWRETLSRNTEELSDFIRLREVYGTIAEFDAMDPLQRRQIESEIAERIAADLGSYKVLSDYFASSETKNIDELLNRYYERLIVNERRVENLGERQGILVKLSEQTLQTRELLQGLRDGVAEVVTLAEQRLAVQTALVQAALNPLQASDILATVNEQTGGSLTAADIPQLPHGDDEEKLREARNALINGLNGDWALASGYGMWLRELDMMIAPLGGLDQRVEGYQDLNARLDATRDDIQRTIGRLVGYSPNELQRLVTDGALGDRERQQLAMGEIGSLRVQRESALKDSALLSLAALVIIPLVGLAVVLLARMVGSFIVSRAAKREAEEPGTTERVRTLNRILQTMITFGAVALSIIYMLQSVNIDVGPLIASLGIFGLALAFGAQSTLKDVFAGFFLLLEKQLNVGDWVIVNGTVGMVESIDLRLTTIRDWQKGGLNYISNGDISSVMNWCRGSEDNPMIKGQKKNSGVGNSWVRFYVTFDSDPEKVVAILREQAELFKTDEVHGHKINDIWVDPGINKIHPDTRCFEFRVLLLGNISIWGAGRAYQNRAVKALVDAGISLPQARINVTNLPPMELLASGQGIEALPGIEGADRDGPDMEPGPGR